MTYDLNKLKPAQAAQLNKKYKELTCQLELLTGAQGFLGKLLEEEADPVSIVWCTTLIGMIKGGVEQLHATVVMWISKCKL